MINVGISSAGMEKGAVRSAAETGKRGATPPSVPKKRLKQACLPFKSLTPKSLNNCPTQQLTSKISSQSCDYTSDQCKTIFEPLVTLTVLDYCKENASPVEGSKVNSGAVPSPVTNLFGKNDKTSSLPVIDLTNDEVDDTFSKDFKDSHVPITSDERTGDCKKVDKPVEHSNKSACEAVASGTEGSKKVESQVETLDISKSVAVVDCTEAIADKSGECTDNDRCESVNDEQTCATDVGKCTSVAHASPSLALANSHGTPQATDSTDRGIQNRKRKIRYSLEDQLRHGKLTVERLKSELSKVTHEIEQFQVGHSPSKESAQPQDVPEDDPNSPAADKRSKDSEDQQDVAEDGQDANALEKNSDRWQPVVLLEKLNLTVTKKHESVKRPKSAEQQLKTQEKLKVQLEIEQLKAELRTKKEEAKKERERQRAEALEKKKRELQEKKDKEEREKLEKKLKKEEKKKQHEALIQKKEQEKQEEKKKAEEGEQRKKEKVKAAFASFFLKKDVVQNRSAPEAEAQCLFLPFKPKANMRLAPIHRAPDRKGTRMLKALDCHLQVQDASTLYLDEVKNKTVVPRKLKSTWPSDDVDVEVVDDCDGSEKTRCTYKVKFLWFSEDVRPPYRGTWRKKSSVINGRRPFGKDEQFFDYEVDSEAEWEEEEPGESLSHTEDEKESEDDYEVDNEFFVPHGYLSDEEKQEEDGTAMSPDAMKAQLKMKELEFENDLKKKCAQIKPSVIGCVWMNDPDGLQELLDVLQEFSAVVICDTPMETSFTRAVDVPVDNNSSPTCQDGNAATKAVHKTFPEHAMPWFIKLVHGNTYGQKIIFAEFKKFCRSDQFLNSSPNTREESKIATGTSDNNNPMPLTTANVAEPSSLDSTYISNLLMKKTLRKIASYGKSVELKPLTCMAWCVRCEVREKYNLTALPIPNSWQYHISLDSFNTAASTLTLQLAKKKHKTLEFFKTKVGNSSEQCGTNLTGKMNDPQEVIIIDPDDVNGSSAPTLAAELKQNDVECQKEGVGRVDDLKKIEVLDV